MTQAFAVDLVAAGARMAGLAVLAGVLSALAAIAYRWYTRDLVPEGFAVLLGVAGVAIYLNTTAALGQVIGGSTGLFDLDAAVVNIVTFAVATVATLAGRRLGDRAARETTVLSGANELDADVGRLVRAVGRVISVTIPAPEDIEDIDGYDPVPESTKESIGGTTFLFPRRLTVAELRDRLVTRLKDDYGVGHVGVELDEDGNVEYLALGSRAAGIGPTLAPGTGATAIRADPAFATSSGDVVEVWAADGTPERLASAEVRGTADDVVTLALDESEAETLDPARRYRLLTLPADPRPEQEFASLLRAADETMLAATVEAGSPLAGTSVGELDGTVVAVRPAGGAIEAIPSRDRTLAAGDTVYAIARPEAIRRIEAGATPEAESSS